VEVKINRKGGQMKIYQTAEGEADINKVEIMWESLHEVTASGQTNETQSIKHFHAQEFTFEQPQPRFERLNFWNKSQPQNAFKLQFNTAVNKNGQFGVDAYIVSHSGVAGPHESSLWNVVPGDIKFNIELYRWKFCELNNCREAGESVDVAVKIKGKNKFAMRKDGVNPAGKGKTTEYELGGGISLFLTNLVSVDGKITEMPEGYPKSEVKADGSVFTFRFPRFADRILYDPIIGTGQAMLETGTIASSALGLQVVSINVFVTTLMAALAYIF